MDDDDRGLDAHREHEDALRVHPQRRNGDVGPPGLRMPEHRRAQEQIGRPHGKQRDQRIGSSFLAVQDLEWRNGDQRRGERRLGATHEQPCDPIGEPHQADRRQNRDEA